jgi:hypothetical protein
MRVYLGRRALEPELGAQKLLPIRRLTRPLEEQVFERRAPWTGRSLDDDRTAFLFRYEVFPERVLRFYGEWQNEGRSMREGDTIVQEASMPPAAWGARLLFGARVTEVKRGPAEVSFSYATLASHAETGVNTFGFRLEEGRIVARITSQAEPGNALMRLAGPVVMRYADWCKEAAAELMLRRFLETKPTGS